MAALISRVTVHRKDDKGNVVESATFGPDDDLPKWAVDAIDNPDVWEGGGTDGDGPPRKNGSTEAWAEYADGKVEVPEGATRSEIIAALDAAGIPTE
jgi:hypothetical protein